MTNILQKRLDKHIEKHSHRRVHKILHKINNFHHTMMHIGELIMIICVGRGSILFANYNTSYESFHRESMKEVSKYLSIAEKSGKPNENNIISTRNIDDTVNNTFAAGYCTYGAARISPEFFPYSEDKTTQERTWGGNAIDRCENAEAAGFQVGANARVGALIIYNPGNGISSLGHVGKVMFYNSKTKYMIIRDMNRISKNIMTDHWDSTSTANVKCYIYPKTNVQGDTPTIVIPPESDTTKPTTGNTITNLPTETVNTGTNTIPENKPVVIPEEPTVETNHNVAPNQNREQERPVSETIVETQNKIKLNLDTISDISKHFMDQYDFTITKIGPNSIKVGDVITLTISAKEKMTNTFYQGILPFSLNLLASNNKVSISTSRIQMIQGDEFNISIKVVEAGNSSVVFMLDDTRIAQISINAN